MSGVGLQVEATSRATTGARASGQPISFGTDPVRIFGFHHLPAAAEPRGVGVVLCNPFGYEAMCTYRPYRVLAERLAAAGFHVLRFDYRGTGDSAGYPDSEQRVRAMMDDIHAAIDELKRRGGVSSIGLFGTRLGALLAGHVVAERDDISSLMFFGAALSGRSYARELRAFQLLKDNGGPELQVAGYLVTSPMIEDLKGLDLLKTRVARILRVLIVPRDDVSGEERLAEYYESCGHEVEFIATPGYAAMMRDVEFATLPAQAISTVESWARAAYGNSSRRGQREPTIPPPAPPLVATTREGVRVSEQPERFGPDDRLFGIVSTPETPGAKRDQAVLFINVGANHHIGSNRLYVTMARDFAARGITSMRIDVSGLGESYAAPGKQENQIYSIACVADVQSAMSLLARDYGIARFVLVGICSGAYLAFHSTATDARVVGQVLMNLSAFEWKEGDTLESRAADRFKASHVYGRSLFNQDTWMRVLRGRVAAAGIARYLLAHGSRVAFATTKAALNALVSPHKPLNPVERDFWRTSDRGTKSLLVYSADDSALDTLASYLGPGARRMRGRANFQMQIIEGADHTFTEISAQRRVAQIVSDFVHANFED